MSLGGKLIYFDKHLDYQPSTWASTFRISIDYIYLNAAQLCLNKEKKFHPFISFKQSTEPVGTQVYKSSL